MTPLCDWSLDRITHSKNEWEDINLRQFLKRTTWTIDVDGIGNGETVWLVCSYLASLKGLFLQQYEQNKGADVTFLFTKSNKEWMYFSRLIVHSTFPWLMWNTVHVAETIRIFYNCVVCFSFLFFFSPLGISAVYLPPYCQGCVQRGESQPRIQCRKKTEVPVELSCAWRWECVLGNGRRSKKHHILFHRIILSVSFLLS